MEASDFITLFDEFEAFKESLYVREGTEIIPAIEAASSQEDLARIGW